MKSLKRLLDVLQNFVLGTFTSKECLIPTTRQAQPEITTVDRIVFYRVQYAAFLVSNCRWYTLVEEVGTNPRLTYLDSVRAII